MKNVPLEFGENETVVTWEEEGPAEQNTSCPYSQHSSDAEHLCILFHQSFVK